MGRWRGSARFGYVTVSIVVGQWSLAGLVMGLALAAAFLLIAGMIASFSPVQPE